MMVRISKLLRLAALVTVGGLVTLAVLAKVLVTPERVKQTIVPLLESSLHRTLQIGAIDIGLFSGIQLDHVVLFEADGTTEFVGVDQVVLRYRFLPLLLLRVEVDEIRLDQPRLRIERSVDGRFNFSDLLGQEPTTAQPTSPVAAGTSTAINLHVARFTLTDGVVQYRDLQSSPPLNQKLSGLNVVVRDFSLRERFPFEMTADWNGNALSFRGEFDLDDLAAKAVVGFNRLQLQLEGDLLREAKGERLRARLKVPRISLPDLLASLPADTLKLPSDFAPSGHMTLTAELDGLLNEPMALLKQSVMELDAVSFATAGVRPVVNGRLLLTGRQLSAEELKLTIGGEKITIGLQTGDVLAQPLVVDCTLSAARLDLDRMLPAAEPKNTPAAEIPTPSSPSAQTEIGPFSLPLHLTATVRIDELLIKGVALKPVELRANLRDNMAYLEHFQADVDGGRMVTTARVNLKVRGLQYAGSVQLEKLPLNSLVKMSQPSLSESLYGTVDGRIDYSGQGTLPEMVKKSLTATGEMLLADGQLKNLPVLDAIAAQLKLAPLQELDFSVGRMRFVLRDGVVQLDTTVAGTKVRGAVDGTIGLDGHLNLQAGLGLAPELAGQLDRKGVLTRVISDREGWTTVPLRIRGEAQTPKISIDATALTEQVKTKALDRLAEVLNKKLEKRPANGEPTEPTPSGQKINDALKGLLGR